jgi:hypothetical protein
VTYPGSGKQQVSAKQSLSPEHIRAAILASWDVPRHRIAGYINLEEFMSAATFFSLAILIVVVVWAGATLGRREQEKR